MGFWFDWGYIFCFCLDVSAIFCIINCGNSSAQHPSDPYKDSEYLRGINTLETVCNLAAVCAVMQQASTGCRALLQVKTISSGSGCCLV